MRPTVHLVSLFVAPLIASACGSDPAADGADATASDSSGADADPDIAGDDAADNPLYASLIGDWEIPCKGVPGGYYALSRLHVTATSVENTYTQHSDPGCSAESKVLTSYVEDSAWIIGEPSGPARALDMVLAATTVEILDANVLSAWNSGSGCGPFTLGVVEDTAGRTCWGFWRPEPGVTYYSIIDLQADTFLFGSTASGDMRTEATRSTQLDYANVWQRVGASSGGFIEGTIGGATYRAEKNVGARLVQQGHIQLGATTQAVTPWETWVVNVPNAVGTYACEDDGINAYLSFGFTEENLPVLWDTEQDGGGPCTITVTQDAPAIGDTIEGSFSGTLGDGAGVGREATDGTFELVRVQ